MSSEEIPTFERVGKLYHGIRYPQEGTIRPPHCVVMVSPEDGPAYELDKATKQKWIAESFDWGNVHFALPKLAPEVHRRDFWNIHDFNKAVRTRKEKDIQALKEYHQRARQLAFAIGMDFFSSLKLAVDVYEYLHERIVIKLPEREFWLTEQQIMDAVGAEIVLAGIARIGEK